MPKTSEERQMEISRQAGEGELVKLPADKPARQIAAKGQFLGDGHGDTAAATRKAIQAQRARGESAASSAPSQLVDG